MNAPRRTALLYPLLLLLLAGCSGKGTVSAPDDQAATTSPDQAEVASVVAANPSYVDDEVSESADQTSLGTAGASGDAGPLSAQAAIQPLAFWRQIRDVDRRFEFAFGDTDEAGRPTSAVVTIHKLFQGSFNILVGDPVTEGNPPEAHVIHKALADRWVRRLLLKRVPLADSDGHVWRIVATSAVKITSRDAETRIQSLRIQSGDIDVTVDDPLAFIRLRAILQLDPTGEATLTATTLRNDDVVLLYLRDHRLRFRNNGDNTYTATFRVPDRAGLHHVGVNALSHGTLFDDEAPYDSQAWITPYVVHPLELADGTPIE
jgi:hypothetical protein